MATLAGFDLSKRLGNELVSRNSSGYGSDVENQVRDDLSPDPSGSLHASRVASPLPVSPSQKIDLFYSDAEVDELIQALESNIHTPGTYYYVDPSCPGLEAPEICFLGAWPYKETAKKGYVKLENCLFPSLNPSQAETFIRTFNGSLQRNIGIFNGKADQFVETTRKYYETTPGGYSGSDPELQNYIVVKSMRTAFELSVPKENRKLAMTAFTKNFCLIFCAVYLGKDPANNEKREFVDSNVKALLTGIVTLSNKYSPLMEGSKGFFASIDKVSAILEKTAKAVKDNRVSDLPAKRYIDCDEGVSDSSALSETAQEHLSEIDEVYDRLLALLNELNADMDTFQQQREVMNDFQKANREYTRDGIASYPYLFGDKKICIGQLSDIDKDFKFFLDDFYEGVDSLYFSHMLFFRKAISAAENARLTLEGIIDRYQELISLS